MESEMDLEYLHMKMEINMLVNSKMGQWMVKVPLLIPMVIKEWGFGETENQLTDLS